MVKHKAKPVEHLYAGWNQGVYGGKMEKAGVAMQSIEDKVIIAYYLNTPWVQFVQILMRIPLTSAFAIYASFFQDLLCGIKKLFGWRAPPAPPSPAPDPIGIWIQIMPDTKFFPGQIIAINVTEDCVWEFGCINREPTMVSKFLMWEVTRRGD